MRKIQFVSLLTLTLALEYCPNGGICPSKNTCCLKPDGSTAGCIPSDLGAFNGTCCSDGTTGCGAGYFCANNNNQCVAGSAISDPLVQTLPRYRLCSTDHIRYLYGWPMTDSEVETKLPYYSSHGPIKSMRCSIATTAVIVIHGAGRNADDYFCSTYRNRSDTLHIAPRFPIVTDDDVDLVDGGKAAVWVDDGNGGPWRYGANSTDDVSSFSAFDSLVSAIITKVSSLRKITIIGHSAGGQFVQRWSLLTDVWDSRFRGVVTNPSSYAYFTDLRFHASSETWTEPDASLCPDYNRWEWGFELSGERATWYMERTLESKGLDYLRERFLTRDLVYLSGQQDVCTVPGSESGWCFSHGLETTCADMLQGVNRWERSMNYFNSLSLNGTKHSHSRISVKGVGHDHSLIFNSPEGLSVIYDSDGMESALAS